MNKTKEISSTAYRLTRPELFEETTLKHALKEGEVVIIPSLASICHADLRYYTGNRRKEALKRKLPMALFHEGIGRITGSYSNKFLNGDRVVIIPNIPGYILEQKKKVDCCNPCRRGVDENYCENSVFLGSGFDGIGQSHLVLPKENVLLIPDDVPDEIAVLAELCSVSLHAIGQLNAESLRNGKIAVFGDGPVGYLTTAMLHHIYRIPKDRLLIFGAVPEKLQHFNFATQHLVHDFNFNQEKGVTSIFECTGGQFSESAVNQAIDLIERKGVLTLIGVSEKRVPINTRDVLEKGLTIYGSSRSTASDFVRLMKAFQNKDLQQTLAKLIPEHTFYIKNANDLKEAMDTTIKQKAWQKSLLSFDWDKE
ncbi:alcohol dehydrogenase catalytic domain-containing protein [Virgibacillus dakarensis]|uniref:alcohol dehydrogenase catalytic domain-containing protein n=1 Tax=Virgibacillus dakarensis TaxID=1917889 RepID=UPI000B452B5E|nr:alcohol dehydrogenase catalytic domain-containing protein [Virgibacillus dakarensis]